MLNREMEESSNKFRLLATIRIRVIREKASSLDGAAREAAEVLRARPLQVTGLPCAS